MWEKVSIFMAQNTIPECPTTSVTVLEQKNDYYAYGERVADSTMQTTSINRWRYNAKEEQDSIASIPYLDYGARLYDPVIGRWMQQDPMAAKYPHLSPYNFCGDNPVNFVDPDGRKIVFINGFSKHWMKSFGYLAPGVDYWSPEVIRKAKKVLRDDKISIESINYHLLSSAAKRRRSGYEYAKENYSRLVSDLDKDESFRFVTHSMGAAFAEGMAEYLREQGRIVDIMLHFSPFQAAGVEASTNPDVLTIDIQTENDPILKLSPMSQGHIVNARVVYGTSNSKKGKHMESMYKSYYWQEILQLINDFLKEKSK